MVKVNLEKGEILSLPLVVIKSGTTYQPTSLGRNWLKQLKFNWANIKRNRPIDKVAECSINQMDSGMYRVSLKIDKLKSKYSEASDRNY